MLKCQISRDHLPNKQFPHSNLCATVYFWGKPKQNWLDLPFCLGSRFYRYLEKNKNWHSDLSLLIWRTLGSSHLIFCFFNQMKLPKYSVSFFLLIASPPYFNPYQQMLQQKTADKFLSLQNSPLCGILWPLIR